MKTRCLNPADEAFQRYGAKGIKICHRWLVFVNFLEDMGERPPGTSLDRIDNSKGYEPGNCRWATQAQQQNNRTNNRPVTIGNETKNHKTWCRHFGINIGTVYCREKSGWDAITALTTPVNKRNANKKTHRLAALVQTLGGKAMGVAGIAFFAKDKP